MGAVSKYTVVVSGQPFVFTRDQLESEPGNYFASYFLGSFDGTSELEIENEPAIFKLIQVHLRGHEVFPFPDGLIPSYMTKESFVKSLLADAKRYKLPELVRKAEVLYQKITKEKQYKLGVRNNCLGSIQDSPLIWRLYSTMKTLNGLSGT